MASNESGPERYLSTDHLTGDLARTTVRSGAVTIVAQVAIAEGGAHTAIRTVYAHQEVRMALEKLFNDKCA